jgi:hypothetical protein
MKEIILIVDDEEGDIINFKDHISELNSDYIVDIQEAFSGTLDKIEEIKRSGNKVVAVFIDLCEKTESEITSRGKNVIRAVRDKYDDILIVAYTQYGDEYLHEAYDHGAHWHVKKQRLKDLSLRKLKSKIEEIAQRKAGSWSQYDDWNVAIFLKMLKGFSNSIKRITDSDFRYSKRDDIFVINDEYDLQDLFWAIYKPIFPEMVSEDPNSKYMGKSSRVDFYIPEIKTILELKHVKNEGQAREIPNQLDNDITWYSKSKDAERLVFYVYRDIDSVFDFNPMLHELNKDGFERNLRTWKQIRCFISGIDIT